MSDLLKYQRIAFGILGGGLTLFLNILIGSIAISSSNEEVALLITNLLSIPIIIQISNWGSSGWMRTKKFSAFILQRKINIIELPLIRSIGIIASAIVCLFLFIIAGDNDLVRYQLRYVFYCIPFAFLWSFSCSHSYTFKNSMKYDILIPSLPLISALIASLFGIYTALYVNPQFELYLQLFSLVGLYLGAIVGIALEAWKGNIFHYNLKTNINHLTSKNLARHYEFYKIFFFEGLFYTFTILPGLLLARLISAALLNVSYNETVSYNLFKSNYAAFTRLLEKLREGLFSRIIALREGFNHPKSFLVVHTILWKNFIAIFLIPIILFIATFSKFNIQLLFDFHQLTLLSLLMITCLTWFVVSSFLMEWTYESNHQKRGLYTIAVVFYISILLYWQKPASIDKFLLIETVGSLLALLSAVFSSNLFKYEWRK